MKPTKNFQINYKINSKVIEQPETHTSSMTKLPPGHGSFVESKLKKLLEQAP
jgi:hypothetical protein